MASSVITALENMIREELAPTVREQEIPIDGLFEEIRTSNMNVTADGIGRGWLIKHSFIAGLAGAVKHVDPAGPSTAVKTGSTDAPMYQSLVWGTQNTFPGQAESTAPALFQRTLKMAKTLGNFYLPTDVTKAQALSASICDYVGKTIKATGKKIAAVRTAEFFSPTDNHLHAISNISNTLAAIGKITYTVSGGKIREMFPGLAVDVYSSNLVTHRNPSTVLIVDS